MHNKNSAAEKQKPPKMHGRPTPTAKKYDSSEDFESNVEMEMVKEANSSTGSKRNPGKVSGRALKKNTGDDVVSDCDNADLEKEFQPTVRKLRKKREVLVASMSKGKTPKNSKQVAVGKDVKSIVKGSKHLSHDVNKVEKHSNKLRRPTYNGSSESDDSDSEMRKKIFRSAEKRLINKLSTLECDPQKVKMSEQSDCSSDSDSAPENVTFENGRKSAMGVLKRTADSIRLDKQRIKEQRKKKRELFKQQEEEKLIQLAKSEEDPCVFYADCAQPTLKNIKKTNALKIDKEGEATEGKKMYFSSEGDTTEHKRMYTKSLKGLPARFLDSVSDLMPQTQLGHLSTDRLTKPVNMQVSKPNSQMQWDTDYIPLDSSGVTQFGVISLDTATKKSVTEIAATFRQNMLYGDRIKRVPNNTHIILKRKLKATGMDQPVTPN